MTDPEGPRTNPASAAWPYSALRAVLVTALFGMSAVTFVDVIGRYVFNAPVPGAYEIVGWLMGIVTFTALPLITRSQSHITVDLFDSFIRGRGRKVQQVGILAGNALVLALFSERLFSSAIDEYRANFVSQYFEVSRAPLLIVFSLLSAAACLIVLILLWQQVTGKPPVDAPHDASDDGLSL